jgi:hypothetical protein
MQFLWEANAARPSAEMAWRKQPHGADTHPQEGEAQLLDRLLAIDPEIVVIDATHPIAESVGLHVVKTYIPTAQPLHAGYGNAVLGNQRLASALRGNSANPWPHPYC